MNTTQPPTRQPQDSVPATGRFDTPHSEADHPGSARSSYGVAVLLAACMTYLVWGLIVMDVPATATWPDPRFFPTLIVIAGYAVAVLLVVQGLRSRTPLDSSLPREGSNPTVKGLPPRWRNLLIALATFVAFAIILEPAGWLIAGALLFWGMAVSLGSRRYLFDIAVAVVVSSAIQLAFSAGLGLQLPVGLLGGI